MAAAVPRHVRAAAIAQHVHFQVPMSPLQMDQHIVPSLPYEKAHTILALFERQVVASNLFARSKADYKAALRNLIEKVLSASVHIRKDSLEFVPNILSNQLKKLAPQIANLAIKPDLPHRQKVPLLKSALTELHKIIADSCV